MLFISEAKKVWWRNAFYGHQKSVHYKMWSDTITEEKGILWYWFWHIRTWGRVKFFISVHTIASKVKMCVAGKIWNGIREKSNQRLGSFYSAATFRPDPPFHRGIQIRQRGVMLSSAQSDTIDILCPSLCTETSLQKLGRQASRRVRSFWKSLGQVSFGSKKFGPQLSFIDFLAELDNFFLYLPTFLPTDGRTDMGRR